MDIFDYFDYRKYLDSFYVWKKAHSRSFSYRAFAQRAGYSSSGLYIDLVKGQKNMTPSLVGKFSKAMNLNDKEQKYFALMVDFTHTSEYDLKQDIFDEMTFLMPNKVKKLHQNQRDYYKDWYNIAIRESLSVLNIDTNYKDLTQFISPKLTLPQVKKSIKLLAELKLIHLVDGFWRPLEMTVQSSSGMDPVLIRGFQKQMMDLGKEALDEILPENRNISCVTFSISDEGLKRIRGKVDAFRSEVLNIVRSDSGENKVCQFNVQFFPLSENKE